MLRVVTFILSAVLLFDFLYAVESPVVKTNIGSVRGKLVQRHNARQAVYEFTGIPFAEPPIGNLRFKKAVPKKPITDKILDATLPTNACPQAAGANYGPLGKYFRWVDGTNISEDCLYLNIWVPQSTLDSVASGKNTERLSVFVWIHGGAFVTGSTMWELYNGAILASFDNIIFVTIQYRLGPLGFSYFGKDTDVPANIGLWDQLEALKWVSENIGAFGGNVKKITIGGQSAGAASTTTHLISPHSRKYFQQAVVESGAVIANWGTRSEQHSQEVTDALVEKVCKSKSVTANSSAADKIKCFRSADPMDLMNADNTITAMGYDFSVSIPVIDGDFIPKDPYKIMEAEEHYKVPLLMGVNKDENSITLMQPSVMDILPGFADPNKNLDFLNITHFERLMKVSHTLIRANTGVNTTKRNNPLFDEAIMLHYWPGTHQGEPRGPEVLDAAIQAVSDYPMVCPTITYQKLFSKTIPESVYAYMFSQMGDPLSDNIPPWLGVFHNVEMFYVFGQPFQPNAADWTIFRENDRLLSKVVMEYWGNFIKYGDPNHRDEYANTCGEGKLCDLPKWPPFVGGKTCPTQTVELNAETQVTLKRNPVMCGFKARECWFWEDYFKKLYATVLKESPTCPTCPDCPDCPDCRKNSGSSSMYQSMSYLIVPIMTLFLK